MNRGRSFKQHYSLLLFAVSFHMATATSPYKTSSLEEPMNSRNCLKYDYQIYDILTSTKPPFDNYFNISGAIYPSEDISSKLVNIWVHFINSTDVNRTEVGQQQFIWSRSCLYVSDRYLSLQAMSLYSLATIWPDRRQEDLHLTMYEFCDPQDKKRKLLKFLSMLEDMAIDPSNFDPSLNNVECVVEANYKHQFKNVNKAFPQICWLILCSSLIGSNFISMLLLRYCKKQHNSNQGKDKSALLFIFVVFWFGIIIAIIATSHGNQEQLIYPLTYLLFIFLVCLRRFIYCLSRKHIEFKHCKITSWKFETNGKAEPCKWFLCTVYPGCFIAVHHILWVMIGIITEPFWAMPVVTTLVMLAFLFYVLSSLYFSLNCQRWDLWEKINFLLLVAVAVSVVLVQFSFLLIGHQFFDQSLISSAIQSALVVIITIWMKSSEDFEEKNNNKDRLGLDVFDGCNAPETGDAEEVSLASGRF